MKPFDLGQIRLDVLEFCERLLDPGEPYGAYRIAPGGVRDLYASCDVALMRVIMGEDFSETLSEPQRREWCDYINSFADPDGSYRERKGHSTLHANGMVIGALGPLGGKQAYPVQLYSDFDTPETLGPWLTSLDWEKAWSTSHAFWGGVHCFSFSARATPAWLDAAFQWLDTNLDSDTGWWCRGVPHQDRHQGLGGAAHFLPLYEHHGRVFPQPRAVIDSVLGMQLPEGTWLTPGKHPRVASYLELDALYALVLMQRYSPGYRWSEIQDAVRRYGATVREYYAHHAQELYAMHPHEVLAAVGVFGGLQQLLPNEFTDSVAWTDIFSDRRLYLTREVEVF